MVLFQKVLLSHKNSGHFVVPNSHHVKSNNTKLTIHHVHVGQAQLWVLPFSLNLMTPTL